MGNHNSGRRKDPKLRPAITPEGRENQLISLAYDRVEQQIVDGTASAQVLSHFLKMGSSREKLERAKLENENLLLCAKVEAMRSGQHMEELYEKAISAMRTYSGQVVDDYDEG